MQPVLWAMMVSLAAVWQAAGVEPDGVVGHSQGEIAAAVVAGGLSLADGAKVVVLRAGLIAQRLAGQGGMVSVALPADQVSADLVEWGIAGTTNPEAPTTPKTVTVRCKHRHAGVWVAVVNGRSATVVSGGVAGLDRAVAEWEGRGVRVRRVAVDYASHSGHVQALEAELLDLLADITPSSCGMSVFSSVTGDLIDTADMTAAYWFDNLRQPVQFQHAVQTAIGHGHTRFLEVSPHPSWSPRSPTPSRQRTPLVGSGTPYAETTAEPNNCSPPWPNTGPTPPPPPPQPGPPHRHSHKDTLNYPPTPSTTSTTGSTPPPPPPTPTPPPTPNSGTPSPPATSAPSPTPKPCTPSPPTYPPSPAGTTTANNNTTSPPGVPHHLATTPHQQPAG